jgi:hypothetical protein
MGYSDIDAYTFQDVSEIMKQLLAQGFTTPTQPAVPSPLGPNTCSCPSCKGTSGCVPREVVTIQVKTLEGKEISLEEESEVKLWHSSKKIKARDILPGDRLEIEGKETQITKVIK